jgi:hypothetical protein
LSAPTSSPESTRTVGEPTRRPSARRTIGIVLVVIGITVLVLPRGALFPAASSDTTAEAFDGPVDRVEIAVDAGRTEVQAGEGTTVRVDRRWRWGRAPRTDVALEGGVLRVTGDCPRFVLGSCQTPVTVTAPPDAVVTIENGGGGVQVSGIQGGVDVQTSAGSVEVADLAGIVRIRSSAGSIRGSVAGDDIDVRTSAGSVTLEASEPFERLAAGSSAGSIDLTVPDVVYRVDATTSAGSTDVDVRTDRAADSEIVARSSAGSVRIRTP